ncbi:helix-turn-helix transcriptional regulator [Aliivibrio fischeri]|uniref:helix-turn-helix transcriptional regulator n=1 Tax=Aliivibrio fischeri TaxID=668 RepID=UPI0007C5BB9B|nr:AlpA family phage regulatory protein [Aliivibrio fischeri]MBP3141047.1 AlpA family phage regulatory protein [Aliivibrio fischeri]MCE7574149.1 AlpA family phage regulatory protein [Aliivibrio fischeri]
MATSTLPLKQVISPSQLSEILQRSRVTIWRWIKEEQLPPPIKINGAVLGWKAEVINQWLDANVG